MAGMILLSILLGAGYLLVLPILTLIAWSRGGTHAEQIEQLQRALRDAEEHADQLETHLTRLQAHVNQLGPRTTAPIEPTPPPATDQALLREAEASVMGFDIDLPLEELPQTLPPEAPETSEQPVTSTARPATPDAIPAWGQAIQQEASITPPKPAMVFVKTQALDEAPLPIIQYAAPERADPSFIERGFVAAKDWLFGGNTIVRVGMLLVFLGLAFLLRYASERVVVPLELRYLGVAATSLVALALGWKLRAKRQAYALLMQGGAVAVMYLTVFAALKLHDQPLLSSELGFALLVAVVVLSGLLAVLQDALPLAAAGALGGFATPILLSTGGGNHVALFTYFALLNTGILGIAWFKAWRPLNLIGFFGTFLIGLAWGLRSFDPALHFANTEPFLVLFFLMFVAIGLLFARRVLLDDPDTPTGRDTAEWARWLAQKGHAAQRYVDGTLLFGTPIVAFGLQYGLIRHIEYGTAFSALAMGAFYLLLARMAHGANPLRHRLLTEIFLALGMIFASLAIPLGLDAQWTCAAWAVEGAGIYWIGQRQQRPFARAFALLLQLGATLAFLDRLYAGEDTLLSGSTLGALMLGVAFLANLLVRRKLATSESGKDWDSDLIPLFATLGLWALYLIAPLQFGADNTAACWAVAGMLTVFYGLILKARGWLPNALLVQLAAGILFLSQMDHSDAGGVLMLAGSGWKGLVIASLIGLAALVSLGTAVREARRQDDPALVARLAWAMLFGLSFIALAVLFVLPWQTATAVWAACGFVLMWAAMRLNLKPAFWFALALEVIAGLAFLKANSAVFFLFGHLPPPEGTTPFAHAGFWTPIVIALAAFAVAWRLLAWARSSRADDADALDARSRRDAAQGAATMQGGFPCEERQHSDAPVSAEQGEWMSFPALLWSAAWWSFGWWMELRWQASSNQLLGHQFLAVMAASVLLLLLIAAKWNWARLATLSAMLLPLAAAVAAFDYSLDTNLLGDFGWAAFGLTLIAGFGLLRVDENLNRNTLLHLANTWLWLGVAALELRYAFLSLGEPGSTWRWLGWTLPLAGWLLWSSRQAPFRFWPAALHPQLYRFSATLPVFAILTAWLLQANVQSAGSAAPLPYIPLVNPLELALLLVLFAGWQWLQQVRRQDPANLLWQPLHAPLQLALLTGCFLTYTCVVLRGMHHLAGIAWDEQLLHSMSVQASLSVAWALLALGLMISGHRRARRAVWITGAALVAVVVAKLFFVELSNHGGLERIISFIGVGVLLLVVGYFAPLPPSKDEEAHGTP